MSKFYLEGNRFCTKIYLGTDENGKKKFKKLKAETEKELEARVYEFKKKLDSGLDLVKADDSLSKWMDRYLESINNEVDCGDYDESYYNTTESRLNYFRHYQGGILAKAKLPDILSGHIQPAVNALFKENPSTGKPTAKRTLERYIRTLANVFEFARKQRAYNYVNPCEDVKVPKKAETKVRKPLNKDVIRLILNTDHRAKLPACIMLLSGLRRGEASALTWDDIDFKNKTINVDKSYDFKNFRVKSTKTKSGIRTIPINSFLLDLLKTERKKSKGKYVIEKARGGIMTHQAWNVLFRSYMLELERKYNELPGRREPFEEFTSHQLRHTYCSMLQWSGVDIKTAQELMGHSEYGVTANIYTHVDNGTKVKAAKLQDDYLKQLKAV